MKIQNEKEKKILYIIVGLCGVILIGMVLMGAVVKQITTPQMAYTKEELHETLQDTDRFTLSGELSSDTEYRSIFIGEDKVANTRKGGVFTYEWKLQNEGNTYFTVKPAENEKSAENEKPAEAEKPVEAEQYVVQESDAGVIGYLQTTLEDGVEGMEFQNPAQETIARVELAEAYLGEKEALSIVDMEGQKLYDIDTVYDTRTDVIQYTIRASEKNTLDIVSVLGLLFVTTDEMKHIY